MVSQKDMAPTFLEVEGFGRRDREQNKLINKHEKNCI